MSRPCTSDEQFELATLVVALLLSMPLWWALLAWRWCRESVSALLGRASARAD